MDLSTSSFKATALPLFEITRAGWLAQARAIAWQLGANGAEVSVDQIRPLCPLDPALDPRVFGAIFLGKAWVRVGDSFSRRKTCHHRRISRFVRTEFVQP